MFKKGVYAGYTTCCTCGEGYKSYNANGRVVYPHKCLDAMIHEMLGCNDALKY